MTTASLVNPELLSHGTLECNDIAATRRFLTEFLGIDVIRPLPEAQYLWKGGPWSVVCVCVEGEHKEQGPQNRFKLAVGERRRGRRRACGGGEAQGSVRHPPGRAGGARPTASVRSGCRT